MRVFNAIDYLAKCNKGRLCQGKGGGGLRVGVRDTPHPRHISTPFRSRAPPNTTVQYSESRANGAWSVRCGRCAPSVRCPVSTINHFDTIFSAHVQKILLDLAPCGDREQLGARLYLVSDDMGDHPVMIALPPGRAENLFSRPRRLFF